MKVFVGQSKVVGPISRYFGRFNFLELSAEPGRCPGPSVLRQWKRAAPKGFAFSIRLGKAVGAFDSDAAKHLEFGLKAAEALDAQWLLLQTPATLGPSQRNRDRLHLLFEQLLGTGRRVAWDPRGVWGEDEVLPIVSAVDVHWSRDPSRYSMVEEPVAYARIPALGSAARVGLGLAERAGENLQGFEEVYLVIEGDGAGRAAKIVRDIANMPSSDTGIVIGDDGVEELSLGATDGAARTETFAPDDEEDSDEESDDEESDDEESDDEDDFEDDEESDDEDDSDEALEPGDDDDEDEEDEEDDEIDPADLKPETIDDSDLPWAPGAKKGRRSR